MAKSIIAIHDSHGQVLDHLGVNEQLRYVNGRICIGEHSGLYYKGIGIPYVSHYVLHPTEDYKNLRYTDIAYLGYEVVKKSYTGLSGIFTEKYQPQFSDFIGTCGNKELSILETMDDFKRSSLIFKKVVNWDKTNSQYYFIVDYLCGRNGYNERGNPVELKNLLAYMIENDWNFIWDKTSIADVSYNGLVTDIADLFKSSSLSHKIGTVYSILYSLSHTNKEKYFEFLNILNYEHHTDMDYIFNSVRFLRDNGVDIQEMFVPGGDLMVYRHIVRNYLLTGKNCAHCSFTDLGDEVMGRYIKEFGEVA